MATMFYLVEGAYPARIDWDTRTVEALHPDGGWVDAPDDLPTVAMNGREVTESEALAFWKTATAL